MLIPIRIIFEVIVELEYIVYPIFIIAREYTIIRAANIRLWLAASAVMLRIPVTTSNMLRRSRGTIRNVGSKLISIWFGLFMSWLRVIEKLDKMSSPAPIRLRTSPDNWKDLIFS